MTVEEYTGMKSFGMRMCPNCNQAIHIGDWPFCPHGPVVTHDAQVSPADAVVLYEHPTKGVRWPGRNDVPVPKHYAREGFERREYRSLSDIRRLERQHNVVSEVGNYDRSGHADRD